MQLIHHPFLKFDQLKPIYNFTYPLFHTISDDYRGQLNFTNPSITERITKARTVSLYIHIPFCDTICSFCPFQKGAYKSADQIDEYMTALFKEIQLKAEFVNSLEGPIRTIYIGGGTPSIMSAAHLQQLGKILKTEFDLTNLAEFTLECEAKSVTEEKLIAARNIGVNRISFGVQTFSTRFRPLFDQTATFDDIENTVRWSQEIIGNVGFDLLYGMHDQSAEELFYDLKRATELKPEAINLYPINNISITPKLHKSYANEGMKPSSLAHRQMMRLISDTFMRGCGYAPCNGHTYVKEANQLPLNNARMSSANHFRYHKYLHGYQDDYVVGFGASAQSILGNLVTRADPNRSRYITDIAEQGTPTVHFNWVPAAQQASKALCMRLPYSGYADKSRIDWENVDPVTYQNLTNVIRAGLVTEDHFNLELTQLGWQWYSSLTFFLLPQIDKSIIDGFIDDMMNAPIKLDGTTEVFSAS
nr:radical SAM protein [Saccharospirillum mangrovi]